MIIFFFDVPATTEFYTYLLTLSLHDALPICWLRARWSCAKRRQRRAYHPATDPPPNNGAHQESFQVNRTTAILAAALVLPLSACGSNSLFQRDRPDEMAVSRQAPLVVPPDFPLVPPADRKSVV